MTDLVDVEPFGVIVEEVEFAVRKLFVPKILEADGDGGAEGGFGDDDAVDAAGVVGGGGFEEVLGRGS